MIENFALLFPDLLQGHGVANRCRRCHSRNRIVSESSSHTSCRTCGMIESIPSRPTMSRLKTLLRKLAKIFA